LVVDSTATVVDVSMKVELEELATRLQEYSYAYLVTVGEEGKAHLLAVLPELSPDALTISGVGKHSLANVELHPTATLVWPPTSPDGFSLIVDGTATVGTSDGEIVVKPTKAILHRPAVDAEGNRTGSDCAPV
jgi:hypothetical protein